MQSGHRGSRFAIDCLPLKNYALFIICSISQVIIDADDLPLNVSRETLQSTKFLKQIKQILVKRLIQLLKKLSTEQPERYADIVKIFGNALKLGAVENTK